MLDRLREKLSEYVDDPFPAIDDTVDCPDPSCNRKMLFRDVFEHFFIQHLELRKQFSEERENTGKRTETPRVRKADLVEDYDLKRPEDVEKELNIQEPTGASNVQVERELKHLTPVFRSLEQKGKFVIKKHTHIGRARGIAIKDKFKRTVRRTEDYSLDNYEIDEGADLPITIKQK